jgi:ornithine cyclodeaminase/alanine dehydrogenase-like protein (mu-crystallin family)
MPDGFIQSQRVGATWALGAKYLAKSNCAVIGIYGSGQQAPAFLEAHYLVCPTIKRVNVYSLTREHRIAFANKMRKKLNLDVVAVDEPRDVMKNADIVMSVTTALEPVIKGIWAEPGMHACCISPNQIDEDFFRKVDLWVAHHRLSSLTFRTGGVPMREYREEYFADADKGSYEKVPTLDDLVCSRVPGRTSEHQITYFGGISRPGVEEGFGSSGTGIQFAAIGYDIYKRAKEAGLGREIPVEWFLQELHP